MNGRTLQVCNSPIKIGSLKRPSHFQSDKIWKQSTPPPPYDVPGKFVIYTLLVCKLYCLLLQIIVISPEICG